MAKKPAKKTNEMLLEYVVAGLTDSDLDSIGKAFEKAARRSDPYYAECGASMRLIMALREKGLRIAPLE